MPWASKKGPLLPELPGEELAHAGYVARLLLNGDGRLTRFPLLELGHLTLRSWVAHPLDGLGHGDDPNVRPKKNKR